MTVPWPSFHPRRDALPTYFGVVMDVVRRIHSDAMDAYVAALESDVRQSCRELGPGEPLSVK